MRCTSLSAPWLVPVYSWKNSQETVAYIDVKGRSVGSPHTATSFPLCPGCRGREPPCHQSRRHPRSNRFEVGLAESRGNFSLLAVGKEEMRFPKGG